MSVLWKATLLLMAAWFLSSALRRASAATRHALWLAALLSLALLPVLSLALPPLNVEPVAAFLMPVEAAASSTASRVPDLWLPLWAIGFLALAIRWCRSYWNVRKLRHTSRTTGSFERVPIQLSQEDASPLAIGWLRPSIILPASSQAWSNDLRLHVLQHEFAHVRRRDCLWSALGRLICAAYWFLPLVWFALRRLSLEAEQACDDQVLKAGCAPADYASILIQVARTTARAPSFAVPMTGSSGFEGRVRAILDGTRRRSPANLALVVVAMVGLLLPVAACHRGPYQIGKSNGKIRAPRLLSKVNPGYTEAARDAKVEGTVSMTVVIDRQGKTRDIRVVQSLDPGLDRNAVAALKNWTFEPGAKEGRPVEVRATVKVEYRLR